MEVSGEVSEASTGQEPPLFCFNTTTEAAGNPDLAEVKAAVFWVEGVALALVASFGVAGNVLTCLVLSKDNVFNQLFVVLCWLDTLFCGVCVLEYSARKAFALVAYTTPVYVNLWPTVIFPLQNVVYTASLAVTMAIAIERHVMVDRWLIKSFMLIIKFAFGSGS